MSTTSSGTEVESRILSVLRRRNNYYKYRAIIQGSFFQVESTKQIFSLINEFFKDGQRKIRKLTVANLKLLIHQKIRNVDLKKECLEIAQTLKSYKSKDNIVIEETIKDFAKRQLVKKGILSALEELELPNPDFTKVQEQIDKALMVNTATENNFYSYFENPEERVIEDKKATKIVTGIPGLDSAIDGGFGEGELIVILAPPERGKTLSLVNLGTAALFQGKTVGYITLELSERKIARRFDLRISGRPVELLREDPSRIRNPLTSLRKNGCDLIIKDYSSESPKIEDIRSFIITYQSKMKKKFDIILIDYADLITPSKMFKQERFGLKEVYTNLRRLANEMKIPFITASQANRKSLTKLVVTIEDFDECFAKAAVADVIFGLCQTPEELEEELCRIFIAKNRSSGAHKLIRLTMKTKVMFMGEYDRQDIIRNIKDRKKSVADKL